MARLDEEFAKEAFSRALPELGTLGPVIWEAGAEPPDFFLLLSEERFAVEVTRIVGQIELDGKRESKRKSGAVLRRFAEALQVTAREQGILRGAYVVWLEPVSDFAEIEPQARLAFLDYVSRTRNLRKAPREVILKRRSLHWSIEKIHDQKDYLLAMRSEGTGGRLSEVVKDLPNLVATAAEAKKAKLAALAMPHILLLVDDYHYADSDMWQNAAANSLCASFHTIARVFQEYECQILYSENRAWSARQAPADGWRHSIGAA
ncbi:MAG: hypothetical protein ABUT39_23345 [Acidobacteriota bacterium]